MKLVTKKQLHNLAEAIVDLLGAERDKARLQELVMVQLRRAIHLSGGRLE